MSEPAPIVIPFSSRIDCWGDLRELLEPLEAVRRLQRFNESLASEYVIPFRYITNAEP